MADEVSKDSKSSSYPKNQRRTKVEFSIHLDPPIKESRLKRFVKKINQFLIGVPAQKKHTSLTGRIHYQIQNDIDKTVNHLQIICRELEQDKQFEFSSLVISVIDQLIKEINRIEKTRELHDVAVQQVREFKDQGEWIARANKWIDLCHQRHIKKEAMHEALIEQVIREFHASINRDLKLIQDYLNQSVDRLHVYYLKKIEIQDQLEQDIAQHVFELYLLKDHPPHLSWEALNAWRIEADNSRQYHFNAALHTIDVTVGEIEPVLGIREETEDQDNGEISLKLAILEELIMKLDKDTLEYQNNKNREKKRSLLAFLAKIENDAHILNGNLRLTYDHVEKIQKILVLIAICYLRVESD